MSQIEEAYHCVKRIQHGLAFSGQTMPQKFVDDVESARALLRSIRGDDALAKEQVEGFQRQVSTLLNENRALLQACNVALAGRDTYREQFRKTIQDIDAAFARGILVGATVTLVVLGLFVYFALPPIHF